MIRRRIAVGAIALALIGVGVRQPTADLRIVTHDVGDLQPHRVQAAIDLGVVAVRLLVTWTARQVR
ncbi:MAG: hypothetical protein JWN21_2426 [Sphingomonas bacterium]|uniref:hypothetical protein n=1 Tax=Sphingomonas bacterium TaxID=1895847 RepID=UPI00261DB32C|nr:hypothetical protein [Sphingomonas bacterium]MDB5696883.1 hypothetical protein [Sphingomonas bacterium]